MGKSEGGWSDDERAQETWDIVISRNLSFLQEFRSDQDNGNTDKGILMHCMAYDLLTDKKVKSLTKKTLVKKNCFK